MEGEAHHQLAERESTRSKPAIIEMKVLVEVMASLNREHGHLLEICCSQTELNLLCMHVQPCVFLASPSFAYYFISLRTSQTRALKC